MSGITASILDHGAIADGVTNDAPAIQRAIDFVQAAGGGRVIIPAGSRVLAGSFQLKSHIDFHVAEGAVLLSATTKEAFPKKVFSFGEEADKRLWIGAENATDITMSGAGTIDGQCRAFALGETEYIFTPTHTWRPALTCFENIRGITVRDLTFRDAANWTLHFCGCEDVDVHDVKIFNNLKFPNADGIDPDHCRRVRIRGCHIVSADDCIVLKNTAPFMDYGPCEDIEITDCRLESASAAFKIGSESHCDFQRIRMSNCTIERSNRGLALQLRDRGNVRDVEFRDISISTQRFAPVFWGCGEAIYVTALPRKAQTVVGRITDVRFYHINCEAENGVVIYGDPDDRIDNLVFEKVHVGIVKRTEWPSGMFDLRPFQDGYSPKLATPVGEQTPWGFLTSRPKTVFSLDGIKTIKAKDLSYRLQVQDAATWKVVYPDAAPLEVRPVDVG
jgi:hypothetical protein